jgi:hypothetical protein
MIAHRTFFTGVRATSMGSTRDGRVGPSAAIHELGDELVGGEIAVTTAHADRAVTRLIR